MSAGSYHTPVLLDEVLSLLLPVRVGTIVDATVGGGGHTEALLRRLAPPARVIGIDADPDAITAATERLRQFGDRFIPVMENFENLRSILDRFRISPPSGILFDLGVSSFQLDQPEKGFSFTSDHRLDMRMDGSQPLDAATVIRTYTAEKLEEVFRNFGEERHSRRIARAVVRRRTSIEIKTSRDLSAVVESVIGQRFLMKSLARIFQALRIEVNNELERLERALRQALSVLQIDGRVVVISYHSLEDRIVKTVFKEAAASVVPSGTKLVADTPIQPLVEILTKKPIVPSAGEARRNPRSRSAKLRAARRI